MAFGNGLCLMSCKSGVYFAKKVVNSLNEILKSKDLDSISLCNTRELVFANSEVKSNILESIRGKDVFIFQDVSNNSNGYSVNDNFMALKTLISASKLSDASRINVIIPAFPYARQDKPWGRESITAKIIAQELESCGANNVITLDIHNPSVMGFFNNCNVINLKSFLGITNYIKKNINLDNLIVSAPDVGGMKRAAKYACFLHVPAVTIYKERNYSLTNCVSKMELIGDITNKTVLLVDDMLDTGGTLYSAIKLLKSKGANDIYFCCSLPFFNGTAENRVSELISNNFLKEVIGTNTVYHSDKFLKRNFWFKQVCLEAYFAKVIFNLHNSEAITKYL